MSYPKTQNQVLMHFELTKLNKQDAERFERQTIVAALFRLCDPLRTMNNLSKGDTVQLKSGGPLMSVNDITSAGVFCQWFDKAGELKTGWFSLEQLKKPEPREPEGPQGSHSTRSY